MPLHPSIRPQLRDMHCGRHMLSCALHCWLTLRGTSCSSERGYAGVGPEHLGAHDTAPGVQTRILAPQPRGVRRTIQRDGGDLDRWVRCKTCASSS